MLDKLLALLLQSKGAAVSLVFVIGSTTALVSAATNDGTTTVTITKETSTQSHLSNEAAAEPKDQTAGANDEDKDENDEDKDEDNDDDDRAGEPKDTTASAGNGCSEQAKTDAAAVRLVDSTFVHDQLALIQATKNKGEDARVIAAKALATLRELRQNAVKAIHAANTCAKGEDEGKDNDEDQDEDNDDDNSATTTTTTTTTMTATVATGADVNAIAQVAVQAMTTAFNDAKAKIDALPATRTKTQPTNSGKSSKPSGHEGEHRSGSSGDKEHERD